MKKFDHDGLLLAEYQGKLFERSYGLNCSSAIFIRRFLHSDLSKKLDNNNLSTLSLDVNEGMTSISNQFGNTDYGRVKYSPNALFWIGYMYRYISYTREVSTKFVIKTFDHRQMNDLYYVYHTQDPEWCVQNMLELNSITEEYFDNNYRLKEVMRKHISQLVCPM